VVIAAVGADVSPTLSVVVVAVAVAWAFVTAVSRNRSSVARVPLPLRILVEVRRAAVRVVAVGEDLILIILRREWLALRESDCNGNCV